MSEPSAYYDRYWSEGGFQPPSNRNPFLDEQIARFGRPGVRIADLGCGDARTTGDPAAAGGADYIGADVSPSAVEAAKARGLDVRLIGDIADTGLAADSFDAVFIVEVLEHLLDPLGAVREAQRILKPSGTLVVTVPNAAVWQRRAELLLWGRPNGMGDDLSRAEPWRDPHIRSFTTASLAALLTEAGYQRVRVAGTEPQFPIGRVAPALARWRPSLFARRVTATAEAP